MSEQIGQAAMAPACEPVEARIRRFQRSYRRRLRKLVRGSKPLSDLLYSFPGAAFVLAAGNRPAEARGTALQLVRAGAPLAAVADVLGLPLWLRRVPPEAFAAPFGLLPDEENFSRRIVNLVPAAAETMPMWLQCLEFSAKACDSAMALWLASRRVRGGGEPGSLPLLPLAAFAWFSVNKGGVGHHLIRTPWHRKIGFRTAIAETRAWLGRVIAGYCMEQQPVRGDWFKEVKVCGYRFVPLLMPDELNEEGERMSNCVATYASKLASGGCLIYSVRRGNMRVATLEIEPAARLPGGRIAQLKGPANRDPPEDVVRAAGTWLARRGRYPVIIGDRLGHVPLRPDRWEAVWKPFCAAKPQLADALLGSPASALLRLFSDQKRLECWQEGH